MNERLIYKPSLAEYSSLLNVWELAVRSTHHFLTEEDIDYYRPLVLHDYFPAVDLYAVRNEKEVAVAFIGLLEGKIEMLFVHPDEQGKGYGSCLLEYAIRKKNCVWVDVNEQNPDACRFYLRKGFQVIGRDELDSSGRPFPILHLKYLDI